MNQLLKYIYAVSNDIFFLKNQTDRTREHIKIKIGVSKHLELCYIDFLDTRIHSDEYEGIKFPLTVLCCGTGTYQDPFYVEFDNDPLVKQVSKLCEQKIWKKFIKNLNTKLHCLQLSAFNTMINYRLNDVLGLITEMNDGPFGSIGFQVSLWFVKLTKQQIDFNSYLMDFDPDAIHR